MVTIEEMFIKQKKPSCILAWLKETYNVPIVAYCADVGQEEDFEAVKVKALKTGAEKCIVDDLKKEFAEDYIFQAIKADAVYETPGVTVLMQAHQAVESITLDKEVAHWKQELSLKFAQLAYNGFWFAPEMKILKSTLNEIQIPVTGSAKLKLYKGSITVLGRQAPVSLYGQKLVSFDDMTSFSAADSGGFININGIRLSNWSQTHGSIKEGVQAGA